MELIELGMVLDELLKLGVAHMLDGGFAFVAEQGLAETEPNIDKEILPSTCNALAEAGEEGTFNTASVSERMRVRASLGQGVGMNVAVDFALETSLPEVSFQLRFVEFRSVPDPPSVWLWFRFKFRFQFRFLSGS